MDNLHVVKQVVNTPNWRIKDIELFTRNFFSGIFDRVVDTNSMTDDDKLYIAQNFPDDFSVLTKRRNGIPDIICLSDKMKLIMLVEVKRNGQTVLASQLNWVQNHPEYKVVHLIWQEKIDEEIDKDKLISRLRKKIGKNDILYKQDLETYKSKIEGLSKENKRLNQIIDEEDYPYKKISKMREQELGELIMLIDELKYGLENVE